MSLDDLGVRVRLYDVDGNDLGVAHLPCPVEPGDLVALEQGPPLRFAVLVELEPRGNVDVLAEVEVAPDR